MRWAGHVAGMRDMRSAYKILFRKYKGKRPIGRPRRKSEDNIRMDLGEIGQECVNLINVTQDRNQWRAIFNTVMNFRVP
jgi:hypothetical protein